MTKVIFENRGMFTAQIVLQTPTEFQPARPLPGTPFPGSPGPTTEWNVGTNVQFYVSADAGRQNFAHLDIPFENRTRKFVLMGMVLSEGCQEVPA